MGNAEYMGSSGINAAEVPRLAVRHDPREEAAREVGLDRHGEGGGEEPGAGGQGRVRLASRLFQQLVEQERVQLGQWPVLPEFVRNGSARTLAIISERRFLPTLSLFVFEDLIIN